MLISYFLKDKVIVDLRRSILADRCGRLVFEKGGQAFLLALQILENLSVFAVSRNEGIGSNEAKIGNEVQNSL